ncbi:MAG: S8 family serine peptidase [Sedimentisphaerales bacterium]|nr:S8 family serine peptidase [Sedimentisphaerales bacterium]
MKKSILTTIILFLAGQALCFVSNVVAYSGGSGTADDPYKIDSKADLLELAATAADYDKCFILTADIDMDGQVFTDAIIGAAEFTGTFDGNNFKITNFTIKGESKDLIGLFARVGSIGSIKNLGEEDINITGRTYVGGLAGDNDGIIIGCYSTGSVNGSFYVGGLAGNNNAGSISSCYSTGSVSGSSCVGGLAGGNNAGSIINCYSTGSVSGSCCVGGLLGNNRSCITNCYSTGSVSGSSYVGGLAGYNGGSIIGCYFLVTSGPDNGYGEPLTDEQMKQQESFIGWDFLGESANGNCDYWQMPVEEGYPVLTFLNRCIPGEIEVTDSIPPVDDLNMPFGDVIIGLSRTEQITLTNTNPYSLVVTDISLGGGYFEDFNDGLAQDWQPLVPSYWDVVSGEYRAMVGAAEVVLQSLYSGQLWQDCSAQVTMRRTGYLGSMAGLVVRASDDFSYPGRLGSGYGVGISGNQHYWVGKWISGSFAFLTNGWVYSAHLNAGEVSNVVMFNIDGSSIDVYFNGNLAWSGTDGSIIAEGRIGLLGYSGSTSLTTHYFDNVLVTKPVTTSQTISDEQQWYNEHPCEGGTLEVVPENWAPPKYPGEQELPPAQYVKLSLDGFRLENVPEFPVMIPPLGSITFDVNFTPAEAEDYEKALIVNSSDADKPEIEVQLSGRGINDYLEVIPDANLEFSGHPGGPFVPTYHHYWLTNTGEALLNWMVTCDVNWLNLSPSSGTIEPGISASVSVTTNSEAKTFPIGWHSANLTFKNINTGKEHNRVVLLYVYTEPKIWLWPESFSVTVPCGQIRSEIMTIGNGGGLDLDFSASSRQTSFTPPSEESDVNQVAETDYSADLMTEDFSIAAGASFAPGRLLVRFVSEGENEIFEQVVSRHERVISDLGLGKVKKSFSLVKGLCLVELPSDKKVDDAVAALKASGKVIYAEPDYEVHALDGGQKIPNDPSFSLQWNMHNTGQSGGKIDADIDAPEGWDAANQENTVVVAVIDTGVEYTHPDLAAQMWTNQAEKNGTQGVDDDGNGYIDDIYGYDFCTNGKTRDSDPKDDNGHGTHCSGIIGATADNGVGVAGVASKVKIMAVKFLNSSGSGYDSDAIDSIEYAALMKVDVMSNSWGGTSYSAALRDSIEAANSAGILFVAAAGNDAVDNDIEPHYPASYPCQNIISVLATNYLDNRSSYSCWGPVSVDLGAPGGDTSLKIYSCYLGAGYYYVYGTSMACPHVSGACAVILSMSPSLLHTQVKDILLSTVDPLAVLNGRCVSGGRLNLYNAVTKAREQSTAAWIGFIPQSGTVPVASTYDVSVIFNGQCEPGTYEGYIKVTSNDPFVPESYIPVTMVVERVDYFTELFYPCLPIDPGDPNCNDVAYYTILFSPDSSVSYYNACVDEANGFRIDPAGGTVVTLGDDDYIEVILDGATLKHYGREYDRFFIGSNGYITFENGDIARAESLEGHFALPRISALFDDLDPSAGGTVSVMQLEDRVVVTFEDVPEFGLLNANNFQIEMLYSGKIVLTLLDIAAKDGLVGLSDGQGQPAFFIESDFTTYGPYDLEADLNADLQVDQRDFSLFAEYWKLQYDGNSFETVADKFSAISYCNNDGTIDFSSDWVESGEADGPTSGLFQVVTSPHCCLRIGGKSNTTYPTTSLTRQADLTGAIRATLSYDYAVGIPSHTGLVTVEVSADGNNWTSVGAYSASSGSGHADLDISDFISPTTMIRLQTGGKVRMYLYIDNLEVQYELEPWFYQCDFNKDFCVDIDDLMTFCGYWLR